MINNLILKKCSVLIFAIILFGFFVSAQGSINSHVVKNDFSVEVEILEKSEVVAPGQGVFVIITVFNLEDDAQRLNSSVEFFIRDEEGNEILSRAEKLLVVTHTSFSRTFKIPEDAKEGKYFLSARLSWNGDYIEVSDEFEVKKDFSSRVNLQNILIILLTAVILIFLWYIYKKYREERIIKV